MIKGRCINPQLLKVLTCLGHGDRVLIADGNFAIESNTGEKAEIVNLSLTSGIPLVTDVLEILKDLIPIERVQVMNTPCDKEPKIYDVFREILGQGLQLEKHERFEFYDECKENDVKLAIATGEPRLCANILLTIGYIGELEY